MTKCRTIKPNEKHPPVICPKCNGVAESTWTRYGPRHSCCGVVSWGADRLGKGKGSEFYALRKEVYAEFSNLWEVCGLEKCEAYDLLAIDMRIPREECKMSKMSLEMLRSIPFSYARILKNTAHVNAKALKLLLDSGLSEPGEIYLIEGEER